MRMLTATPGRLSRQWSRILPPVQDHWTTLKVAPIPEPGVMGDVVGLQSIG